MTKPCVGCSRPVPEQAEFPYPDCADDCPLATAWRKEHVDHERAIAAARAAGYREGVEAAAERAENADLWVFADAIRELAVKKENPKEKP